MYSTETIKKLNGTDAALAHKAAEPVRISRISRIKESLCDFLIRYGNLEWTTAVLVTLLSGIAVLIVCLSYGIK